MGVDINFNLAIVVPFTDYKEVEETTEQVRYDEYTGEKKVSILKYTTLYYKDEALVDGGN